MESGSSFKNSGIVVPILSQKTERMGHDWVSSDEQHAELVPQFLLHPGKHWSLLLRWCKYGVEAVGNRIDALQMRHAQPVVVVERDRDVLVPAL